MIEHRKENAMYPILLYKQDFEHMINRRKILRLIFFFFCAYWQDFQTAKFKLIQKEAMDVIHMFNFFPTFHHKQTLFSNKDNSSSMLSSLQFHNF